MKKNLILILVLALSIIFTACGANNNVESSDGSNQENKTQIEDNKGNTEVENTAANSTKTDKANEDGSREIIGLDGKPVVLPPVEEIKNIVVMHPTLMSYAIHYVPDRKFIVGSHIVGIDSMDKEIRELLFPEWKNVNTSFTAEGTFGANIEELMKLEPDVILYDAKYQGEGLDKVDTCKIPIDVYAYNDDTERVSIEMDKFVRAMFGVEGDSILEIQWKLANNKAKEIVDFSQDKKTILFIWQDMGEQLLVGGAGTDTIKICESINLANSANEIDGVKPVNMEQIYQWDPDYIFLVPQNAKEILAGEDKQKDWSKLTAFKENHIYSIPLTQTTWNYPSMDSPLGMYYFINKCYPEKLSDDEMDKIFFDYYKTVYNIELEEDLINRIMNR